MTKQPVYIYSHKEKKWIVATPATQSRVYFRCIKLKMERCIIDDPILNSKKINVIEECEEVIDEIDNSEEDTSLIQSYATDIRKNLYYINRFGNWKVNKVPIRGSLRLAGKIIDICIEAMGEVEKQINKSV